MKKSDLKTKMVNIKAVSTSSHANIVKPKLKTEIRMSNDSLSKSIRTKKDAQTFINELKNALNK